MFKTKLYMYDSTQENNGYRGTDYSKYVLQGAEISEDITQELDTAEITLSGLTTSKEFDPESKFIVDIVGQDVLGNDKILKTLHFCVAQDVVSQPILSDDNYFDHHISFIEPSVIAQKRLVDNIAVTHKLKSVTLDEVPAFPDTTATLNMSSSYYYPEKIFGTSRPDENNLLTVFGKYFSLEGSLKMLTRNGIEISSEYINVQDFLTDDGYMARFIIPKLAINKGVDGSYGFSKIGYASIDYVIEEFSLTESSPTGRRWTGTFISNSSLGDGASVFSHREWLLEKTTPRTPTGSQSQVLDYYFKKYTDINATTPTYITQEIPILEDRTYRVSIYLHEFTDNLPFSSDGFSIYYKYTDGQPTDYCTYNSFTYITIIGTTPIISITYTSTNRQLTANKTSGRGSFTTYSVNTGKLVYASSTPYSALALLQKAIINSSIYEKQNGVYIADINNSNLPFYVDDNFVDSLSATVIIENFYNQKNLWEVMLEVGNYIHAIPELKFGSNDRFMITFNPLGRTDEKEDTANKVSIFNSRSVEDYISATSSYITNMVQLGGIIEEWVVPKTTNEQLLVSNDTAEIIVSKPIIELVEITVKNNNNNSTADLTPFIYEENVYKTLQIDYDVNPNRGIAMYYRLGTNVITGGQYQLPQANTNVFTDYTFKKIIWCAYYGYNYYVGNPNEANWGDIKIGDYSFLVKYRTKDSVRQNHIRPDLRKYLVNSKFDRYPEHNQFNNQTDVVVDSIKFGNNMYGKLIRTGNSTYEKLEWTDKVDNYDEDLKHKGELYRINGDLYYVAKITHYYFSSYILSRTIYSKDYNELSKVVGIPSEPRFYEISEQSLIWREFALNDILLLTDDKSQLQYKSNFVFNFDHISGLIIGEDTDFAKYAITVFKGDKDIDDYDQTIGQPNFYKEVFNAVNAYSSENTLTYEWDMEDNYSAGDKVVNVAENTEINADERAYNSLWAVPYTDIYGKAALLDFYILGDVKIPTSDGERDLSISEIKNFPESPISTKREDVSRPFVGNLNLLATNVMEYDTNYNGRGIGLLKDCREAMSINFNLQLATNSDNFVISPYVFSPNKKNVRIVLLAEEVNKLSSGYINNSIIITPIDVNGNTMQPAFEFSISIDTAVSSWDSSKNVVTNFGIDLRSVFANVNENHFNGTEGYQQVKAIAILCDVSLDTDNPTIPYKTQFIIARNIPSSWNKTKATSPIYFGAPNKDEIFKNKQ